MAFEETPAPVSTMPYPPVHTDKEFVILSDWLVLGSSSARRVPSSLSVDVDERFADRAPIFPFRHQPRNLPPPVS